MCGAVLLEESKTATPQVDGAHLSAVRCPYVPRTSMLFVFLPRIALFYIMTHASGEPPRPYMRVPWPGVGHVLSVELAPSLNALIAVAGSLAGESRLTMKAWAILGKDGCAVEDLKLVPRTVSQRVARLEVAAGAAVEFTEPAWAPLWRGGAPVPAAGAQRGAPTPPSALLVQQRRLRSTHARGPCRVALLPWL